MTKLDLNELERLATDAKEISSEPWFLCEHLQGACTIMGDKITGADATFMAACTPDSVLALIAQAREAERLREELRTSLVIVGNLGQRAEALEADNKRLREELEGLEKVVRKVSYLGAQTGPQWVELIVAVGNARATLDRAEEKEAGNGA